MLWDVLGLLAIHTNLGLGSWWQLFLPQREIPLVGPTPEDIQQPSCTSRLLWQTDLDPQDMGVTKPTP